MGNEVQNLTGGFATNRPESDLFRLDNSLMPEIGDEIFEFRPFGFQEKTLFNSGDLIRTNLNARADKLAIPRMDSASEIRLAKINPQLADRIRLMAADLKRQGIDVVAAPKGDLRTVEQQNELYKIGRCGIEGEKPVTWVKGGNSYHNYGLAVDVVLKDADGNPTWDASASTWKAIGQAGERQGLEWGGRWSPKNRDEAHFQLTGGAKTAS